MEKQPENIYGHLIRLKSANMDFLTVEDLVPSGLAFNTLFIDINFSKLEVEIVFPKIKFIQHLQNDIELTTISKEARVFKPVVRPMTSRDRRYLIELNRYSIIFNHKIRR